MIPKMRECVLKNLHYNFIKIGEKKMKKHPNHPSVDQSDRVVPYNLRQSGRTPTELLISTRVRKSPFWHLSHEAGCWRATIYNRIYHPRGYVKPEDGGAMVEYDALVNRVTMWNVAVERQIRVKGPDAEAFTDFVNSSPENISEYGNVLSEMEEAYKMLDEIVIPQVAIFEGGWRAADAISFSRKAERLLKALESEGKLNSLLEN